MGLSSLKTLIDTLDTVADSVQSSLENQTYGLDAIHTDVIDHALRDSDVVTAIQAADFEDGSGTNTLSQVLAGIVTAVGALQLQRIRQLLEQRSVALRRPWRALRLGCPR